MWFDKELGSAWLEGYEPAIRSVGYDPLRVDLKQHNNKICDEIVAEIRRSRFVIADFTGHRGGVYYEAGYAAGLGLPIIFTCRKGHMDHLHFDIRQFNCIDWTTTEELRARLGTRVERQGMKFGASISAVAHDRSWPICMDRPRVASTWTNHRFVED
jgi:nucleoside 2-deoxyribosyltransferase